MRMRTVWWVAGLMVLSFVGVSYPQVDLAKALVGTWEGEVKARMQRGAAAGAEIKLIITSVTQQDGKWVAAGSKPSLRFKGAAGTDYALTLFNDKEIAGTATLTTEQAKASAGDRERDVRLEKKN